MTLVDFVRSTDPAIGIVHIHETKHMIYLIAGCLIVLCLILMVISPAFRSFFGILGLLVIFSLLLFWVGLDAVRWIAGGILGIASLVLVFMAWDYLTKDKREAKRRERIRLEIEEERQAQRAKRKIVLPDNGPRHSTMRDTAETDSADIPERRT